MKDFSGIFAALVLLSTLPVVVTADNYSVSRMVVIHKQYSFTRSIGIDAYVEMGVGVLALILFAVSALAYYRDRRSKFLVVCLAFFAFMVKGALGFMDLVYPGESSMLLTFSDLLDFVILLLLFIAVMRD